MPLASDRGFRAEVWAVAAAAARRDASSPRPALRRRTLLGGLLAVGLLPAAGALAAAPALPTAAPASSPHWMQGAPQPLAAHFQVRQVPSGPVQDWYFYRQADSVHLIKPQHEEVWRLSPQGQVSFERFFLADRRSVHYSPGELLTLGLRPHWPALQRFADLAAWASSPDSTAGQWRLTLGGGTSGGPAQEALWSEALQLPLRITRRSSHGASGPSGALEWRLISHHPAPLATWPLPNGAGRSLEQVDAADLGDLLDKDFAAKAERLDVMNGWRAAHEH
ncbi:hypothetical protein [Ideonella paludis]|uniref:hypothetical protein n=1 Tax=Ideonella paludis TaxID=1233411 RepID=UPI003630A911